MKKPPVVKPSDSIIVCSECGAENRLPAARCWLCYRPLSGTPDIIMAESVGNPPPPPARPLDRSTQIVFGAMTFGVFGLVCLVSASLVFSERDLLLPVAIVILPAVIATSVSLLRSTRSDTGTNWQRAFATMMASFGITMGVLVLLAMALFVTLFAICVKELMNIPHGP